MTRGSEIEFSAKVRDQAAIRADGHCDLCKLPFNGRPEFDHILCAAYGGKPVLANCQALCRACHLEKTIRDIRGMRKADRQRRACNGAKLPKQKIQSRRFPKSEPKREPRQSLAPRSLYEDR
jgi:5-methylcytosine-specific restriction enzyme A